LEEKRKSRPHKNNAQENTTNNMSNNDRQKLAGKVAVVTGGSRGIGAAITKRLAADGASVAFTYPKGADAAASVVKEIERSGCSTKAGRPSSTSFYGGNAHGYTDYPFHEESKSQQAA
jgi:NAD(P)-dependent dehydrogenase (short-subunit alcohol dehydrogenase family)